MAETKLEEARARLGGLRPIIRALRARAEFSEHTQVAYGPCDRDVDLAAAALLRALAAAPPPPDVSRGLDREEVAVTRDHPMAVIIRQAQDDFLGGASRITDDMAMFVARRIIALSAPAVGGLEVEPQYSSLRSAPQPALGGKPPLDEPERAAGAWNAEQTAHFLFGLLDDIDTASDIAKADDALYRALVQKAHRRRFEVASTDGYIVTFTAAPAQPQETHDLGPANTLQGAQGAPAGSAPADTGRGE